MERKKDVNDLNINKKESLVRIGAIDSNSEVTLSRALEIADDMTLMNQLQNNSMGTYEVMLRIKTNTEELG